MKIVRIRYLLVSSVLCLAALSLLLFAAFRGFESAAGLLAAGLIGALVAALIAIQTAYFAAQSLSTHSDALQADTAEHNTSSFRAAEGPTRPGVPPGNAGAIPPAVFEFEILSRISAAILIASPRGQISYANPAAENLFGGVRNRNLTELIGPDFNLDVLSQGDHHAWRGEISLSSPETLRLDCFVSITRIDDPKGEAIVAIVQDISDEKVARDAAVQSEKMASLTELVAGTSHELNNPLAIVTGYSDLLLEDPDLTAGQRSKLESIRKSAMRASSVIHSLLLFARKRKPERVRTDINGIVNGAIRFKESDLKTAGIEFEANLAEELPAILADPHQIQEVLLNVMNNAQDAVMAGSTPPQIRISTERGVDSVIVQVADSGVGISAADLKRVFDPFFTTKPVGGGTGLGLSIAYGIVREHGGTIDVKSVHGGGTTVTVTLPTRDIASKAGPSYTHVIVDPEARQSARR